MKAAFDRASAAEFAPRRGFTLVEIMIVVLIIGILLAVALPSFSRARAAAQAKACQGNLRMIVSSKERWAMEKHKGPNDTPLMSDLVVPGDYMRSVPVCPAGGTYTINNLATFPTCTIGGVPGDPLTHEVP